VSGGTQTRYTPAALERAGDFSESRQNNGALITITDPATGAPFPGNRIPAARFDPTGLAMLNYFPLAQLRGHGHASQRGELLRGRQRHASAAK